MQNHIDALVAGWRDCREIQQTMHSADGWHVLKAVMHHLDKWIDALTPEFE